MSDFTLAAPQTLAPLAEKPFDRWPNADGTDYMLLYRRPGTYVLRFPEIADFELFPDSQVACTPAPGVPEASLKHLFVNQVQPLIFSRNGKLVLHASAVADAGSALAFVGPSGRGKSTLAAFFSRNGSPFLADDGLVLEREGDGYLAMPSHPSIRLWEDSEAAILPTGSPAAPPVHYTSKSRFVAVEANLTHSVVPHPLRVIYFPGEANTRVEGIIAARLGPSAALSRLMQCSFVLDIEDRSALAKHFDRLATLANSVPCFSLDYATSYEALPKIIDAIRRHAAQDCNSQ